MIFPGLTECRIFPYKHLNIYQTQALLRLCIRYYIEPFYNTCAWILNFVFSATVILSTDKANSTRENCPLAKANKFRFRRRSLPNMASWIWFKYSAGLQICSVSVMRWSSASNVRSSSHREDSYIYRRQKQKTHRSTSPLFSGQWSQDHHYWTTQAYLRNHRLQFKLFNFNVIGPDRAPFSDFIGSSATYQCTR